MTDKQKTAEEIFSNGFNCAQATLAPFAEDLGLDRETGLKLSTGFGGGARMGELCGAVTGSLMALGLKRGHTKANDADSKAAGYVLPAEFEERFLEKFGSLRCKELLGYDLSDEADLEKIKELNLFENKCPLFVTGAAAIVEELLGKDQT